MSNPLFTLDASGAVIPFQPKTQKEKLMKVYIVTDLEDDRSVRDGYATKILGVYADRIQAETAVEKLQKTLEERRLNGYEPTVTHTIQITKRTLRL